MWWNYARETPFYEYILANIMKDQVKIKAEDDETLKEMRLAFLRRKYWRYRILSRITFGNMKTGYAKKTRIYFERIRAIVGD